MNATFPNTPSSVPAARRLVEEVLAEDPPELRDRVKLMVSELATNAVKHANSDFTIEIQRSDDMLRVTLSDSGRGRPAQRAPSDDDPNGRGLIIVQAMSDHWGIDDRAPGKAVWFSLHLAQGRVTT
jgi:anti-sigma regulatory factor (Ser/Thr protein kinase)